MIKKWSRNDVVMIMKLGNELGGDFESMNVWKRHKTSTNRNLNGRQAGGRTHSDQIETIKGMGVVEF